MKDKHKNIIVIIIIAIASAIISHYVLKISMLTIPLTFLGLIIWLNITPFKIEDDEK
jgi:hypothetical protein